MVTDTLKDVLKGVASDLGYRNFNEAEKKAPDDVAGYTVRVVIVGYSFGATRAVDEADNLGTGIREKGMIPEITVEIIDGVEFLPGEEYGKPLTRLPADPGVPTHNHYTKNPIPTDEGPVNLHGGEMPGAASNDKITESAKVTTR